MENDDYLKEANILANSLRNCNMHDEANSIEFAIEASSTSTEIMLRLKYEIEKIELNGMPKEIKDICWHILKIIRKNLKI